MTNKPKIFASNTIGNRSALTAKDISKLGNKKVDIVVIPTTKRLEELTIFDCTAASPMIIPPTTLSVCAIFDGSLSPSSSTRAIPPILCRICSIHTHLKKVAI